ncbi:MAG TPA: hypothetical protein VII30_04185 [Gemmatimonadaceae bacterium]
MVAIKRDGAQTDAELEDLVSLYEDGFKEIQSILVDGVWWKRLETLAGLPPEGGRGWHTFRRKFATELKHVPLADLAYLGGWQSAQTILKCYQQPDDVTLRSALAKRGTLMKGGLEVAERTPRMDTTEQSGTKEKNPASA